MIVSTCIYFLIDDHIKIVKSIGISQSVGHFC